MKFRLPARHFLCLGLVALAAVSTALSRALPTPSGAASDRLPLEIQLSTSLALEIVAGSIIATVPASPSVIGQAAYFREVVFLGAAQPGAPSDLYRAQIKTGKGGVGLSVKGLRNLTRTPAGDEYALLAVPPYVGVATRALGQVRAVTVYDFRGEDLPEAAGWSIVSRATARMTDYLLTGRWRAPSKTSYRFALPPQDVTLRKVTADGESRLAVHWHDAGHNAHAQVLGSSAATTTAPKELVATVEMRLPKTPILWLVDTARTIWWIGPGPIEWAEGRFFASKDALKRTGYALFGAADEGNAPDAQSARERKVSVPPGREVGTRNTPWPPREIAPPVFSRRAAGEGSWRPAVPTFVRPIEGAPTPVYRTFVRPDRERPYVRVELFAMDMRQLDLHMVGGYEDPEPTTGSQGTGRIPREPDILNNVVLAFNGAFKTLHGAYGMMVDKDVLLPPKDTAATVATLDDGRVLMGSWPVGAPIPPQMRSLRQNMDPLVEDGKVNPRRRYLWGFTLDEDIANMNTIRSGVCATEEGTLIYAWGEDLTATTLGVAMNAAGCRYGLHLDMNPFHTSFIYYRFAEGENLERPKYEAEVAIPQMLYSPYRYVNGSSKDFFS